LRAIEISNDGGEYEPDEIRPARAGSDWPGLKWSNSENASGGRNA
jgi:hypothetical protein